MSKSLLESVVSNMLSEDEKAEFINKVYKSSGISKTALTAAYERGKGAADSDATAIPLAKAHVYSYVSEHKVSEASEGPFRIWDRKAKTWVGKPYSSRKRATSRADRLDNEYGGYRYSVRLVHPQDTNKEITPAEKAKLGNK
jgi:hypothetical protein